jgi:hypothetical protein
LKKIDNPRFIARVTKFQKSKVLQSGLLAVAVAACVTTCRPASATPSLFLMYPSDALTNGGFLRVSSDLFTKGFSTTTSGFGGVNYGFGSNKSGLLGRSEIGLDYVAAAPFSDVSFIRRTRLNIKTQLYDNPDSGIRIVAGAWGVGSIGDVSSSSALPPNIVYVLGSKRISRGSIQLGLARALSRKAVLATPAGNSDRTFIQLGLERELTKKIIARLDYYSGKSNVSALVPGVLVALNDRAGFRLGYIRYNDESIAPARNQFLVAFDYSVDLKNQDGVSPTSSTSGLPALSTP